MAKQGLGVADLAVKNPQIGAPVMTVGDIAAALKPISPDTAGNRERIIHWGRAGALEPIGHAGGGPGKHRLYSSDAKFDAAVLHVLTSAGLPVNRSQFLPERHGVRAGAIGPLEEGAHQTAAGARHQLDGGRRHFGRRRRRQQCGDDD